jgi:two-component system phosphate regulon sensor histidine kinase PhoR
MDSPLIAAVDYAYEPVVRFVADALPFGLCYVDNGLRYRFRNRTHEDWFGRRGELGIEVRELLGERAYAILAPYIARALKGERTGFEVRLPSGNSERTFRVINLPDLRGGFVAGFFALIEDVSDKRRMIDELSRSKSELSLIMDSVPAMIWYKDADNCIVRCNQAAARSKGLHVGEVEGRLASELFPPEKAARYHQEDLEIMASGEPKHGIVEQILTPAGDLRWVETDKFPLRDERGAITGVIVFSMDVTDRVRAEQVLRESEKQQRDFVANVSHEFRTPLAAIKASAETLRNGALDDRRAALRFVSVMERHAERLGWLVEQLLTLSSLESDLLLLNCEPLSLLSFVDSYVASLGPLLNEKKLVVKLDIPPDLKAFADEKYLTQVLENLFSNAIKFNVIGGWIRVTAKSEGGQAILTVADGGMGIPEKDLPFVFERFYRGSKTRKKSGHTGLGLHIAKKIMEALNGRIRVESAEGRGAAFHLNLPLP